MRLAAALDRLLPPLGIDERVGAAGLLLLALVGHPIEPRMRAEPDVRRERRLHTERPLVVRGDVGYVVIPDSTVPGFTAVLPANTTDSVRPPSTIAVVHVVQPFVCPGVCTAFNVMPPSATVSPSASTRSTFTAGNGTLVAKEVVAAAACLDELRVALHDHHLRAAGLPSSPPGCRRGRNAPASSAGS